MKKKSKDEFFLCLSIIYIQNTSYRNDYFVNIIIRYLKNRITFFNLLFLNVPKAV